MLDRCREFDLFASVDAHLCELPILHKDAKTIGLLAAYVFQARGKINSYLLSLVLNVPELMHLRIRKRMLDRFSGHGGAV
jgi:hypothetical protein